LLALAIRRSLRQREVEKPSSVVVRLTRSLSQPVCHHARQEKSSGSILSRSGPARSGVHGVSVNSPVLVNWVAPIFTRNFAVFLPRYFVSLWSHCRFTCRVVALLASSCPTMNGNVYAIFPPLLMSCTTPETGAGTSCSVRYW